MVETVINDINDVQKATITSPQKNNSPDADEVLRKQIIIEEEIKAKVAQEAAKKATEVQPKVNLGAPQHVNQDTTANPNPQVIVNDGLTADDMSRINQDMNNLKREIKQEVIESDETKKKLEAEMRAKIIQELKEEQAKKTIANQVANSSETIKQLQEQIKVLNERVSVSSVGQEVDNKSPFDDEKKLESASESDIKRIDEASRMAFQRERMRL